MVINLSFVSDNSNMTLISYIMPFHDSRYMPYMVVRSIKN
jgi:hypothetical protein